MKEVRFEQIGIVGVDTGQVMICDPTYVEGQWARSEDAPSVQTHDVYRDKKTGKLWQFMYGGKDKRTPGVNPFPDTYETPLPEYQGKTPNQLILEGVWEKLPEDQQPKAQVAGEFSYRGCGGITLRRERPFGQLRYPLGHNGAGVASATMRGDGSYPVYAVLSNDEKDPTPLGLFIDFTDSDYDGKGSTAEPVELLKEMLGRAKAWRKECERDRRTQG